MSFEDLLGSIHQCLNNYQKSGDADVIYSESVMTDLMTLWDVAQPLDPDNPTDADCQRLLAARHASGWLHFYRYRARSSNPDISEFAAALVMLAPLAGDPDRVPTPLRTVLGPAADGNAQAAVALGMLNEASTRADPNVLTATICMLTASVEAVAEEHFERLSRLANLSLAYQRRYEYGGFPADLNQAIQIAEYAVTATPHGDPARALRLSNLGVVYQLRHDRTGLLSDLDDAIQVAEQAVTATAADHRALAGRLTNLSLAYQLRYRMGAVLADLERAIEVGERALKNSEQKHLDLTMLLANLGGAYYDRYERTRLWTDLNRSIQVREQAVAGTADGHPERASRLACLGISYQLRHQYSQSAEDLDLAIRVGLEAVEAASNGHSDRGQHLFTLGLAYWSRYERDKDLADLDRLIEVGHQAVETIPNDHPDRVEQLAKLGSAYHLRYKRGQVPTDLDQAIQIGLLAMDATPSDHPNRLNYLSWLKEAYRLRSERTGTLADAEKAIQIGEQLVRATSEGDEHYAGWLSDLGDAYRSRSEHSGSLTDLNEAIRMGHEAVAATPEDHRERAGRLGNLSVAYLRRYERVGRSTDLDQAIQIGQQAVVAASGIDPERAKYLSNLCGFYLRRYSRNGVLADLNQAIQTGQGAVDATPNGPEVATRLCNLGAAHQIRHGRTGVAADLDRAIEFSQRAVAAAVDGDLRRPTYLANLGSDYLSRYEHRKNQEDLDHAIYFGEQALATLGHHTERPWQLANVGHAYMARYDKTKALADLEEAIRVGEEAVSTRPEGHLHRASLLASLSNFYKRRYDATRSGVDLVRLRTLASQVDAAAEVSPVDRLRVCHAVGLLAHIMEEDSVAVELLDTAVAMLPLVPPRESGWADQEHRLGDHLGLIGDAVAAHCAINDPVGAVSVAELGRGILLAAQVESRADLTELAHADPELASSLREIRERLISLTVTYNRSPGNVGQTIEDRKRLWSQHDALLARIRQMPPFARFLLPPTLSDLQPVAAGGVVILVNVGTRRSDAIIVKRDGDPLLVHLPHLRRDEVYARASNLLDIMQRGNRLSERLWKQRSLTEILEWLWDTTVEPALSVLEEFGSDDSLPRVWWLPTGLLGLFPLHAAGRPGQHGALDTVVSSYIPTMRTLAYARARPSGAIRRQLTVALKHTPGMPDLPGTIVEAAEIHAQHPDTPLVTGKNATSGRVLTALPDATWVHFACHATADLTAPSQGGLQLYDGILSIPDIARLHLQHADLAYLSACSTAHRGIQHAEEAISLASAFHLAGFRHVIGSLWPLTDYLAAAAARLFYRYLPAAPGADSAARILNKVTRELRAEYPYRPDLWAALIHSGL